MTNGNGRVDWAVVGLIICLALSISATVVVSVLRGTNAIAGTGLGVLTATLASALAWRVKNNSNGGRH